jgi:hypothetical protein
VIHTHSPSSGAFLRLVSLGTDNVAFIHTEHNVSAAYRPVIRMLHRVMAWRIDELVAVSAQRWRLRRRPGVDGCSITWTSRYLGCKRAWPFRPNSMGH